MDDAERTIRQLRAEAREQLEDAEAAVAELARASRTLRDAVLDHARSGRRFRIDIADTTLAGSVVHVGSGLVRLVGAEVNPIDISLDAITGVQVTRSDRSVAVVTTGYPDTPVARARELVQANARVQIRRRAGQPIRGELVAATATHLEVADGEHRVWLVPLGAVGSIERIERSSAG